MSWQRDACNSNFTALQTGTLRAQLGARAANVLTPRGDQGPITTQLCPTAEQVAAVPTTQAPDSTTSSAEAVARRQSTCAQARTGAQARCARARAAAEQERPGSAHGEPSTRFFARADPESACNAPRTSAAAAPSSLAVACRSIGAPDFIDGQTGQPSQAEATGPGTSHVCLTSGSNGHHIAAPRTRRASIKDLNYAALHSRGAAVAAELAATGVRSPSSAAAASPGSGTGAATAAQGSRVAAADVSRAAGTGAPASQLRTNDTAEQMLGGIRQPTHYKKIILRSLRTPTAAHAAAAPSSAAGTLSEGAAAGMSALQVPGRALTSLCRQTNAQCDTCQCASVHLCCACSCLQPVGSGPFKTFMPCMQLVGCRAQAHLLLQMLLVGMCSNSRQSGFAGASSRTRRSTRRSTHLCRASSTRAPRASA